MSYKDNVTQTIYQREWISNRRKQFLEGKKCAKCGSKKELVVARTTKGKRIIFSSSLYKLDEMLRETAVLCKQHYQDTLRRPIIHGTLRGYKNRKCRCKRCTAASTRHWRVYRKQKEKELREIGVRNLDAALKKLGIPKEALQ